MTIPTDLILGNVDLSEQLIEGQKVSDKPAPLTGPFISLGEWRTHWGDSLEWRDPDFPDHEWKSVRIPHNWEGYEGYPGVSHGNLHGTAWYRTEFNWDSDCASQRLYAFFEGVGSYAQVFCNGILVGEHAGGLTSFTVDLTPALQAGANKLAVRAHHPEKIDDLPFICGGCWGSPNTEGTQPFGIFRPAWLERTGPIRVEPFGLHMVTAYLDDHQAAIEARVELRNADKLPSRLELITRIFCPDGTLLFLEESSHDLAAGECRILTHRYPKLEAPLLWHPDAPHLYTAEAEILIDGVRSHATSTKFGLRQLDWPALPSAAPVTTPRLENHPATRTLFRAPAAPSEVVILPPRITLDSDLPDQADLIVDFSLASEIPVQARLFGEIQNENGTVFFHQHRTALTIEGETSCRWNVPAIYHPRRWSDQDPYLHKLVLEVRDASGQMWERQETYFGIQNGGGEDLVRAARFTEAPISASQSDRNSPEEQILRINGRPFFINGTCAYETLLGGDHAFTDEQIAAEVAMIKSAGFNAFRDAHHPHNLRYYDHWDREGILCWTQMGSHIWFDNERFRSNFRKLVGEWVRERRNHPSVILWGIQNESVLPEDFTRELREIICALDPSCPGSRLTTTCNGGKGADWNVPQDWTGTYGGNFNDYDLARHVLVGEYGAWREFGVHTEKEYQGDENDRSESWACQAMETKIRFGERARSRAVGHFHWVFSSFPNPGRSLDNFEGPVNHEIGSINNKGLFTAWRQPSDLYYLYRANFADPAKDPMVYIVSHTWPDRWKQPEPRTVRVFSNCERVELFDGDRSLGVADNPGRGYHFQWPRVNLKSGQLRALGFRGSVVVAADQLLFDEESNKALLQDDDESLVQRPKELGTAIYRVSCGEEEDYSDRWGRVWKADQPWKPGAAWGCSSWAESFPNVPGDLASRGYTMSPVRGTSTPRIYRTYRYGREKLAYHFVTGPGKFRLRLHLVEPWYGIGGGADCRGWRLFDVAVNGTALERDLDIWRCAGGDHRALCRDYEVTVDDDVLTLSFPFVRVNQALICGIEIFA